MRSMGMGNAHVTLDDGWSIFNNIGAMSRVNRPQAMFSYDHRLNLRELTTIAAGGIIPHSFGHFGFSMSHYGGLLFNQQNLGLGFSNTLGIASFGLKINYFQTNIESMGRNGRAVIEIGSVSELTPQLLFGIHIYNPTRTRISKNAPDHIPTVVRAGVSYRPSSGLMLNVDAKKDILLPPQVNAGIELNLLDRFWGRCGIHTDPANLFFGIGFKPKKFHIDYAMGQNHHLGATHHFSFNYIFSAK